MADLSGPANGLIILASASLAITQFFYLDMKGRFERSQAELAREGIGYKELAQRLEALGVKESEQNIANKLSRGGFSAVFLIQCVDAIGKKIVVE